jgi:hypothetical protein
MDYFSYFSIELKKNLHKLIIYLITYIMTFEKTNKIAVEAWKYPIF